MRVPASVLVALCAATPAHAVEVHVAGIGRVELDAAAEACLQASAAGSPTQARVPAFQAVARRLLEAGSGIRTSYFSYHSGLDWPTEQVEVSYVGDIVLTPPGRVAACTAVGQHWVREGLRIEAACADGKGSCKDAFPEAEWEIVKEALKVAKRADEGAADPFFQALEDAGEGIASWTSPLPFLEQACDASRQAAAGSRFLDEQDLRAARLGCMQQLVLIQQAHPPRLSRLTCDTPWRKSDGDAVQLVASPTTDLAITAKYVDDQLDVIYDRLERMNPWPAACGGDYAANWRKALVQVWRDSQLSRACSDETLDMEPRTKLCPSLLDDAEYACDDGDPAACLLLGRVRVEGFNRTPDLEAGLPFLLKSCTPTHNPGCLALLAQEPVLTGWFDAHLQATAPLPQEPLPDGAEPQEQAPKLPAGALESFASARTLLETYGDAMGSEWTSTRAQALFDAAMSAWLPDLAQAVLDTWGEPLDPVWLAVARTRHAERVAALAAATPAPVPPE